MKITDGEIIVLSDNKEYVCLATQESDGNDYMLLMSNSKPIEIKFGAQTLNGENIEIRIINNQSEKLKVLELFKNIKIEKD